MKNWNINRQTALKGALLVALAANIGGNKFLSESKAKSTDLLSVSEVIAPSKSGSHPVFDDGSIKRPESPNALKLAPAADKAAEKTTIEVIEVAGETTPLNESLPSEEATMKVCGAMIQVTYQETLNGNKPRTEILVSSWDGHPAIKEFTFMRDGSLQINRTEEDRKQSIETKIVNKVKSDFAKARFACKDEVVVSPETAEERAQAEEEKRIIAEEIRLCKRDKRGEKLDEPKRVRCLLDRLSMISSDKDDDRRAATDVMRQIEGLLRGDLKRGIRNRLISSDEELNDEGHDFVDEAIESIRLLAEEYQLDRMKTQRLIGELEAMKTGGATYRRAIERTEDVNQLATEISTVRNDLQAAWNQYRMNPSDTWASQQVLMLQQQDMQMMRHYDSLYYQIQNEMSSGPYANLMRYRQNGLVDTYDFNLYAGPYDGIRRQLSTLLSNSGSLQSPGSTGISADPTTGPIGSSGVIVPTDLTNFRSGLATSFGRNHGILLPQHPNITFGNYGSSAIGTGSLGAGSLGTGSIQSIPNYGTTPNPPSIFSQPTNGMTSNPYGLNPLFPTLTSQPQVGGQSFRAF